MKWIRALIIPHYTCRCASSRTGVDWCLTVNTVEETEQKWAFNLLVLNLAPWHWWQVYLTLYCFFTVRSACGLAILTMRIMRSLYPAHMHVWQEDIGICPVSVRASVCLSVCLSCKWEWTNWIGWLLWNFSWKDSGWPEKMIEMVIDQVHNQSRSRSKWSRMYGWILSMELAENVH